MEEKKSNIKILVACHKADPNIFEDDIYMPIQVGKSLHPDLDLGIQCDNTEDNISEKNGSYCELTALYWAWKNTKFPIIGLAHYRRYLLKKKITLPKVVPARTIDEIKNGILTEDNIVEILKHCDVILPQRNRTPFNLRTEYCCLMNHLEYVRLKEVIRDLTPEIIPVFEEVMWSGNSYSPFNMFVMPREKFNEYCEWLFPILSELEKRLDISSYTGHFKRIYGYIGERLLNIFVRYKNWKIAYVPTGFINDSYKTNFIKETLKDLRADVSFLINMPIKKEGFYK